MSGRGTRDGVALNAVWLTAAREFTERTRNRTFLLSNAFILLIIVAAIAIPAFLSAGDDPHRLGVLPGEAEAVAAAALSQQDGYDADLELVPVADRAAAERALADGTVDSVLIDAGLLLSSDAVPGRVRTLLTQAAGVVRLQLTLDAAGLDDASITRLLTPLALERVAAPDGGRGDLDLESPTFLVAAIASFLLYGVLALLGQWVAQGIVEEKQSRVVEVLLSALRPTELLVGKVLGLGAVGLVQMLLLAGTALGASVLLDGFTLPSEGLGILALVIAWFIPGYLLYALLFAAAGATVARVEDLQSAVLIPLAVLVGALLAAQAAVSAPTSTFATVITFVPFTAPIVQPILVAAGAIGPVETGVSLVLALLTLVAFAPLVGRIYRGGLLRGTRVSLREAARSGRG